MVPRFFELHRHADESGVSGTGFVAEGVMFSDGSAALRWRTQHRSTAVYANMRDVVAIHGHGGKTEIRWVSHQGTGAKATLRACSRCLHPMDDHWADNCDACMVGDCKCALMTPGAEALPCLNPPAPPPS